MAVSGAFAGTAAAHVGGGGGGGGSSVGGTSGGAVPDGGGGIKGNETPLLPPPPHAVSAMTAASTKVLNCQAGLGARWVMGDFRMNERKLKETSGGLYGPCV